MKKTHRTKRMARIAGLLAVLALTATGCQVAPNPGGPQNPAPTPADAPKVKFSTLPATYDPDAEGWNSMDGELNFKWSAADKASIEKNGRAILEVLVEDHPEFTVEGFERAPEVWDSRVAPKLKPVTLSSAWPTYTTAWTKEIPPEDGNIEEGETAPFTPVAVLTNAPEILESSGMDYKIVRSWKSKSGEKCSVSEHPYEINARSISISTRPDGTSFASAYPIVTGQYEVTVHCKEGSTLKSSQRTSIQLKKENAEWVMSSVNTLTGSGLGAGEIEK
jgi:hypothetical protein